MAPPSLLPLLPLLPLLLLCALVQGCPDDPQGCICQDKDAHIILMCLNTNLERIPTLPANTQQLYLQGNSLGLIAKDAFQEAVQLERLHLENCGITDIEPGAFNGLTSVTQLNLKDNKLKRLEKGMLAGMPKLVSVDLNENQLESIGDHAFEGIESNVVLNFQNNHGLKTISEAAFEGAPVQEINFFNNSLTGESLRSISPLNKSLEVLYLHSNKEPLRIDTGLFQGFSLRSLNLEQNGITDVAFLNNVVTDDLSLEYNNIGTVNFTQFPSLRSMRILRMSHTNTTAIDGSFFTGFSSLTQLYLAHNQIASLPRSLRTVFNSMTRVALEDNALHCNCELLWFKQWAAVTDAQVTSPHCASPTEGALEDIPDESFKCIAPSFPHITQTEEGSRIVLRCSAEGDPAPVISWKVPSGQMISTPRAPDRKVRKTEGAVTVEPAGGTYICYAHNVAENVSREVVMTAYSLEPKTVVANKGQAITATSLFLLLSISVLLNEM